MINYSKPTLPHYDAVVIGAGLAGSVVAHELHEGGQRVLVIDKSRGTGGRASSKRLGSGSCDMGATSIRLHHPSLQKLQTKLLSMEAITPWNGEFVGVPRMSAICRTLLDGIELKVETRIHHLERMQDDWLIRDDGYKPVAICKLIIMATPATQSAMMLATTRNEQTLLDAAYAASAYTYPQWALWCRLPEGIEMPVLNQDQDVLSRLVCDSRKPYRTSDSASEIWVVQTQPKWTLATLDVRREQIKMAIIQAVEDHCGHTVIESGEPHRWLLGQQAQVVSHCPNKVNTERNLWLVGDWLCQGDGEGALVSATLAARDILAQRVQKAG